MQYQSYNRRSVQGTNMDCRTQLASMAIDEVDKGDFEMATKILTTSIRLEPNNHELYFERSICHHKLANYQASLEDANAAIRLNSSDYNIHYQKGLALIGLSMFSEAVASFKKAIELRAKQDDSKLSDIFKLLRDATNELNTARRRPGTTITNQTRSENTTTPYNATAINHSTPSAQTPVSVTTPIASSNQTTTTTTSTIHGHTANNEPVDSTTDKPNAIVPKSNQSTANATAIDQPKNHLGSTASATIKNGTTNLVAISNRNNNQKQCANQMLDNELIALAAATTTTTSNRVSSTAAGQQQQQQQRLSPSFGPKSSNKIQDSEALMSTAALVPSDISKSPGNHSQLTTMERLNDSTKSPIPTGPFDWNIRRSERIFLHNSSEPGTSGPNDETSSQPRARLCSNPSSVGSVKGANKRLHPEQNEIKPTAMYQAPATRNGTNSIVESEIDVDDSSSFGNLESSGSSHKRVMVTPSSSMPATSQQCPTTSNAKEDSYSSKYKRLRRDRERARRGTSKLCTIKPSDLDELHRMSDLGSEKRFMRVIAPIDGWLYSGQLSLDNNNDHDGKDAPQYVVKLDGDTSDSSYLFSQETVLNDVIKEVRVKSVSELRKGARICCYWSRTYKCLSTGVVTSRTFEATKSLVSVKYDNGDLSAVPLEDLRLLPPDYPKYMSNCDPLLLAKNGDTSESTVPPSKTSRIVVDCKSTTYNPCATASKATKSCVKQDNQAYDAPPVQARARASPLIDQPVTAFTHHNHDGSHEDGQADLPTVESMRSALDDDTIPPTDETINFITSEEHVDDHDEHGEMNGTEEEIVVEDNLVDANETTPIETSRASSEENNYGIEYRPWVFEGPPKRSKRNGRTYRDTYSAIRRGSEIIKVGDSAELMPRDESVLPFIAKIDGIWATSRGEMRVRVRWYYRLVETEGEPYELEDGENALFETDHFDENDVQSIWRATKIISWTEYARDHSGHANKPADRSKIFYLAGYYDPVRRVKHLRSDVKTLQ